MPRSYMLTVSYPPSAAAVVARMTSFGWPSNRNRTVPLTFTPRSSERPGFRGFTTLTSTPDPPVGTVAGADVGEVGVGTPAAGPVEVADVGCPAPAAISARSVCGPTIPSTVSLRLAWNCRTASCVRGPASPSTASPLPKMRFSPAWTQRTYEGDRRGFSPRNSGSASKDGDSGSNDSSASSYSPGSASSSRSWLATSPNSSCAGRSGLSTVYAQCSIASHSDSAESEPRSPAASTGSASATGCPAPRRPLMGSILVSPIRCERYRQAPGPGRWRSQQARPPGLRRSQG